MQLGLFNLMTLRDHPDGAPGVMRDTRKMVETAEELGFDVAWLPSTILRIIRVRRRRL